MFLRCKVRRKDGKQHRYWSVVENTRVAGGRVVQRHVLYLGEINDTQELARPGVQVKLLAQEGELYVLAQSRDRVAKERAMRRRQLKRLWARLRQLATMALSREELLMKLGAARDQSRAAWRVVTIEIAADSATFSYRL